MKRLNSIARTSGPSSLGDAVRHDPEWRTITKSMRSTRRTRISCVNSGKISNEPDGTCELKGMNEKIPIPCQACKATGLRDGIACKECGGKGHRMPMGGQLAATARLPAPPKRWRSKPQARRR